MISAVFHTRRFKMKRAQYYKRYSLYPDLTPHTEALEDVRSQGLYVVPNFIDRSTVTRIMVELEAPARALWESGTNEPYKTYVDRDYGVARLMHADEISPTARSAFFENEIIASLARAYVSPNVVSYQRMIEYRAGPGLVSQADNWHFDDWKHRFKAFLYLVDVDESACPLTCLPGTHHHNDEEWRLRKEIEYDRYGKRGSYGYYMFHEIKALCAEKGWQPRVLTAPAGTLILMDTRILHRGTTSRGKERFLLANYFDVRSRNGKNA